MSAANRAGTAPGRGLGGVQQRIRRWLDTWRPLLPVLFAEFVILLGFGALLPVMPLYVQEHGIDLPTLGLIVAAWSIAKLVAEPIFGYLADHTSRKPFLVGGAIVIAIATVLPVWFTSAVAFILLRAISGAAAGAYDPAARGMIVDATPPDERGEAFGIYTSFQMGGFVLGPVVGAVGASIFGGYAFPFVLTGALTLLAALILLVALPAHPHVADDPARHSAPPRGLAEPPFSATTAGLPGPDEPSASPAPLRDLLNPNLATALVIHFGMALAFGVYEVIWSLFLTDLGASIEWVGLTFALFGLPVMLVSPFAGRLVDRFGPIRFAAGGGAVVVASGVLYALASEPVFPSVVVPFEAIAEAFLMPALFALVALGSPHGRSSTAQGLFGAVGTIGLIVASISAGVLYDLGQVWPFVFFVIGAGGCLAIGLAIHRWAPSAQTASGSELLTEA
jgi:DHA1 family multidrug resistance protein-like MFS transporter